jgi:putative flippase GtrA
MIPSGIRNIVDRLAVAWRERALALKALSFGLVGVVNTVIDLVVFLAACAVLGIDPADTSRQGALMLVVANVAAWLVAVSCSYAMNSLITFAAESGRQLRWRDYGKFVASGVAGVIANTTTLLIAAYFLPVIVAKLLAILASFLVNFSLSHFVVFRPRRRDDAA